MWAFQLSNFVPGRTAEDCEGPRSSMYLVTRAWYASCNTKPVTFLSCPELQATATAHSARLLAHIGIQFFKSYCLFCLWTWITDLPESVEGSPPPPFFRRSWDRASLMYYCTYNVASCWLYLKEKDFPLLADRFWAPPSHLFLMCGETARVKRPEREGDLA